MGFFDRLLGKSSNASRPHANGAHPPAQPQPAPTAPAAIIPPAASTHAPHELPPLEPAPAPTDIGPVAPRLTAALELLELRNLDGAKVIYDEILHSTAGDRPDVLVRISGDLGATGHIEAIVELIAPRYDADRHGPATGINLLQAYLALHQPEAAQHVLDLLFALQKPELEERLWGFSNAIGELMVTRRRGAAAGSAGTKQINLVSVSKPIWAYGIETLPGLLPNKDNRVRRIAFTQLALPSLTDAEKRMAAPEDALGRFSRGLPLWFAETFFFSQQYTTIAAVGLLEQSHYALFPHDWTSDNIRQLIDTAGSPLDYVVTGSLTEQDGDFVLTMRLWEIKSFRERKSFEARWTPSTADAELAKLHANLRLFFEWKATDGLPYTAPSHPTAWIDTLGASLSAFLADKNVLPRTQLVPLPANLAAATSTDSAALARLTLADRASRTGSEAPSLDGLPDSALLDSARAQLGF